MSGFLPDEIIIPDRRGTMLDNLRTFCEVFVNGKKAKIIGKVCMDSFMIDVSDIDNIKVGDEVFIWDNENITLDEVASKCDTINYEILSCISNRVPRIFKGGIDV